MGNSMVVMRQIANYERFEKLLVETMIYVCFKLKIILINNFLLSKTDGFKAERRKNTNVHRHWK